VSRVEQLYCITCRATLLYHVSSNFTVSFVVYLLLYWVI